MQVFRQGVRSYRELPLRLAEFGSCRRYEPSGALHGLMRVRASRSGRRAHFLTEAQCAGETSQFVELLRWIYAQIYLGFPEVRIRFADRPPVELRSDAVWDQAEGAFRTGVRDRRGRVQN